VEGALNWSAGTCRGRGCTNGASFTGKALARGWGTREHTRGVGDDGVNTLTTGFNNQGTLVKTAGEAASQSTFRNVYSSVGYFHNSGLVELQAGRLLLQVGGAQAGPFAVGTNTVLGFSSGTFSFGAGTSVTGEGRVQLDGVTVNVTAPVAVEVPWTLSGGTLACAAPLTVRDVLNWNSGTVSGAGDVLVEGVLNWSAGTLSGTGVLGVTNGASFSVSGSGGKALARVVENWGTAVWSGGNIDARGGVVNNRAGGVWELAGDQYFDDGVFNNQGTLVKTAGEAASQSTFRNVYSSVGYFHNSGLVELQAGRLLLQVGGAQAGPFAVGTNTVLGFSSGTFSFGAGTSVTGEGRVQLDGVTVNVTAPVAVEVPWTLSGGTLACAAPLTVRDVLNWNSGTVSGAGDVLVEGVLNWSAGTLSGTGVLGVTNGASFSVSGSGGKALARVVENWGTAVWSGGNIDARGGVVNNRPGGVWELAGDQYFDDGVFNNQGTLVKTAGEAASQSTFRNVYSSVGYFHNSGLVELQAGRLYLNVGGAHRGSFALATGTTLAFAGGTHALAEGCGFGGLGTVRFQTPIQLGTDIDFGALNVILEGSATLSGDYLLSNRPDGTITFAKSMTVPGSLRIEGTLSLSSTSLTVTISGTLTLETGGVLNNPGTLRVGAFVDNGGTLIGNSPVVIGPQSVRIDSIELIPGSPSLLQPQSRAPGALTIILRWQAAPGQRFTIEASSDLMAWREIASDIAEIDPGVYQARLTVAGWPDGFFQLKSFPAQVADPSGEPRFEPRLQHPYHPR
jgi:hypothetical protein